jgi:hypothetical protein
MRTLLEDILQNLGTVLRSLGRLGTLKTVPSILRVLRMLSTVFKSVPRADPRMIPPGFHWTSIGILRRLFGRL